jgi:hypothetical protein
MTINAIGRTPTTWPVESGQQGTEPGSEPSALTEKLMWSPTGAIGQSPSSDAEPDAPTTGRLVDEYA